MSTPPILLVVFNRPSKTRQVLSSLRQVKPAKLYVAADGPRPYNTSDRDKCKLTKEVLNEIDWKCELVTLFREHNLGCKLAVSGAIDWFFTHEEAGIILEDDVVPNVSFYNFCAEMLDKYRDDSRIGMVTGSNLVANKINISDSYSFSSYANIWGWATWKRAWKSFDVKMDNWPTWKKSSEFKLLGHDFPVFKSYWIDVLDAVYKGKIDTWDFQWFFNMWCHKLLCVIPRHNLIENIGFDNEATHTDGAKPAYILENPPKLLESPLIHPKEILRNKTIDIETSKTIFKISWKIILKNRLRRNKLFGNFLSKVKRTIFSN